ncbi:MAG: hypothetical protein ACM30I_04315 [Gemmatimonas sp.]
MTVVRPLCAALALCVVAALAGPSARAADAPDRAERTDPFALNDEDRAFLEQLQRAVAADDRSWVADQVRYPINVTLGGVRDFVLDRDEFLAHYDEIINARVRGAIMAQRFDALFKNWQGTMIGRGEVWFYHRLDGSNLCREVPPNARGVKVDCTIPDPARRWVPPRTGIDAINNVFPPEASK